MLHASFGRSLSVFAGLSVAALMTACGPQALDNPLGEDASPLSVGKQATLRLMAANISSGNYQSYDPGEGGRIFQGLKPDVVMIQEFNYKTNSASEIRAFVDGAFGAGFQYYRETGAQIPNGIISRWPIVEAGEWKDSSVGNRDFAWARIDIPGPKDLWAVSVHFLTRSSSARNTEASQLVGYIRGKVPAGDYLALGGDFNTDSRGEPAIGTLSSTFVTAITPPKDHNGNSNTNASRRKPYDWVLVDADLNPYQVETAVGSSIFPSGLVVDTRTYSPISEIAPARPSDSGAVNMQHMAIVRDFLIPAE